MTTTDFIIVFVTTSSKAEAQKISRALLEAHQAACVNIIPAVDSHFWWQNKIENAQECLLVVKSRAALLGEIISTVKKMHSYSVPEIIAMPIIGGNPDYLQWLANNTKQ
ncbi:MAG: divalent-cation tolerance protein CutA [Dehalococcoidales bacterium]|nr:divalent-cation tolerance protein CutA [Dehalococcoidales bacterium]